MNAREDYIASQYKPKPPQPGPPGSGPGSQGNVNSNPANDWIGSSQDTSVYYGNLPQSQGNTNVNVSNPSGGNYQGPSVNNNNNNNNNNNQTGAGATGGTGTTSGPGGMGLATLAGIDASKKFLGTRQPGFEGLVQDNLETYGLTGKQNVNDLEKIEVDQPSESWKDKFQIIGDGGQGFNYNLTDPGTFNYNINDNMGFTAKVDPFDQTGGIFFNMALGGNKAKGGPVGIMSLPEGYAAGGPVGVDPSDWRIIQQIIASGGNPEDYINYADGGDVNSEGTSYIDPTADNYFLRQFGQYLKRFLPRYDPEQDEYRHKKNREKKQGYENGGSVSEEEKYIEDYLESLQRPPTAETPMERKPFGGTRENVMDQIEAFDNAPVHMEEPMVGMYGEKVPLTLARRVQKYMEGLDPVKRNMIQETLNMFQMKKRMEEMQELQEEGNFFGAVPNEYEA